MSAGRARLRFGTFEVSVDTGELFNSGRKLRLPEKSFRVLVALVERPGELVTREEIARRLWPDGVFVDVDHGLNAAVHRLRAALGDTAGAPRFIETLSGRGYRFIVPVEGGETTGRPSSGGVDSFDHISGVVRLRKLLEKDSELSSVELRELPAEVAAVLERLSQRSGLESRPIGRLASLLKAIHSAHSASIDASTDDTSSAEMDLSWFVESLREDVGLGKSPLCVGRDRELARLHESLRGALIGRGGLVFVTGEAGSGKSVLLHAFARQAVEQHPALVVAAGSAGADPYLAFRELLGHLTGELQVNKAADVVSVENALRLSDLLESSVHVLLKVAPDLVGSLLLGDALSSRVRHSDISAKDRRRLQQILRARPPVPAGGAQQASLFDQCTQFLIELGRKKPLLLMLHDLHWADAGTVSLLFHLCRRVPGHPILIVGSYRSIELVSDEEGVRHPLEAAVHELQSQFGELELRLEGSPELADAIVDSRAIGLSPHRRQELFSLSQGNPLFIVELMNQEGSFDDIPPRIEAVIADRLSRLPARHRRILDLASVDGEEFTAEVIASAAGSSEREVVQLLSGELDKRCELVRPCDARRHGDQRFSIYRFRNPLYQRYLYQRLDEVERSYLHEELGRTLERLASDATLEWAWKLARHFDAAGMPEAAARYAKAAGNSGVRP